MATHIHKIPIERRIPHKELTTQPPQITHTPQSKVNTIKPSSSQNQIRIPVSSAQQTSPKPLLSTPKQQIYLNPQKPSSNPHRPFVGLPHSQPATRIQFSKQSNIKPSMQTVPSTPVYINNQPRVPHQIPVFERTQKQYSNPGVFIMKNQDRAQTANVPMVDNPVAYYMDQIKQSQQLLSEIQGLIQHRQGLYTSQPPQNNAILNQKIQNNLHDQIGQQQVQFIDHLAIPSYVMNPPHESNFNPKIGFDETEYQQEIQQHIVIPISNASSPQNYGYQFQGLLHQNDYQSQPHQIVFNSTQNQVQRPEHRDSSQLQQIKQVAETRSKPQTYQLDELKDIVFGDQKYQQIDEQHSDQKMSESESDYPNYQYPSTRDQYIASPFEHQSPEYNTVGYNPPQQQLVSQTAQIHNIYEEQAEDQLRIPNQLLEYQEEQMQMIQSTTQRKYILDIINKQIQEQKRDSHSKRQSHSHSQQARNPNFMMYIDGAQLLSYFDLHQRLLRDKDQLAVLYQQSFGLGPVNQGNV